MNSRPTTMHRLTRWVVFFIGVGASIALAAAPAQAANNTLVSSSPADGETVASSPQQLLLTFSAELGATNQVAVRCNDTAIGAGTPQVGVDKVTLTVALPNALPKGACQVSWLVSAPDGTGAGSGNFAFTIAADTVVTQPTTAPSVSASPTTAAGTDAGTSSGAAGNSADGGSTSRGPEGLTRLIVTISLAVLFGSLVLTAMAWPEGVEYILTVRFLRTAWLTAVLSALAHVACLTSLATGKSIAASFSPGAWSDLADTGPGLAALARLLLAAACGWVVVRPERVIDPASQMLGLALPGLAVATLGLSRSGGPLEVVGYALGIGHALAMAVWIGGLVLLTRVVLAGPGDDDLVHAVRGFSRISTAAITITVLTGLGQMVRLDRGAIFSSGHGRVLLLKTVCVAAMLLLGLAARQFIREKLAHVELMSAPLAVRLRRALGVEAVIGVVVLVLTAWMLTLPPAKIEASEPTTPSLGAAQLIKTADGIEVQVSISQVVGLNAVLVEVIKPETGISSLTVEFIPPPDSGVTGVILKVPDMLGPGAVYLPIERGLPLSAPGSWTITLRAAGSTLGSKTIIIV